MPQVNSLGLQSHYLSLDRTSGGGALLDLKLRDELPVDLFGLTLVGNERLTATTDRIRQKFGSSAKALAHRAGRSVHRGACGSTRLTKLHNLLARDLAGALLMGDLQALVV